MVSNFEFLRRYWPDLAQIGEAAETYLYSDPNACVFKIGMLSERIVAGIFRFEKIEMPDDLRQSNMIRILERNGLLPRNIDAILFAIRKARNDAAHAYLDSVEQAKTLLRMAYSLSVWYMEVYGDWNFVPSEYVEPQDISEQDDYKGLVQAQEEKIRELTEKI
jgi:type I restriction enzyme R subunit